MRTKRGIAVLQINIFKITVAWNVRKIKLFQNPQISPSGPPKLIESLHNIHSTTKEIPGDGPLIDINANRKYLVLTNKTNIIHHKSAEENLSSITYKNPVTPKKKKFNNQYYNPF